MLKRLKLKNFKIFDELDLKFGPLNVLIGPNGSGKSTLLRAVYFLKGLTLPDLTKFVEEDIFTSRSYKELTNLYDDNDIIEWALTAEVLDYVSYGNENPPKVPCTYDYSLKLQVNKSGVEIKSESLSCYNEENERIVLFDRQGRKFKILNGAAEKYEESEALNLPSSIIANVEIYNPDDIQSYYQIVNFKYWLEGILQPFDFDPKALKEPGNISGPYLNKDGGNLPSAILNIGEDTDDYKKFFDRISSFYPAIQKVMPHQAVDYMTYLSIIESADESIRLRAPQLADGLLRLLAVNTLLYNKHFPFSTYMIEEPENGVHPQLLRELVGTLKLLTYRKPPYTSQVFITTHSPYLLDEFRDELESVYVFNREKGDNIIEVKRLSEIEGIDMALEKFSESLGEIWFSNLIGG